MKNRLKTVLALAVALALALFVFIGCADSDDKKSDAGTGTQTEEPGGSGNGNGSGSGNTQTGGSGNGGSNTAAKDTFKIETEVKSAYTSKKDGSETVYTFTKGGEFTLSGELNGRLVFAAAIGEDVIIYLNGCNITTSGVAVSNLYGDGNTEIKSVENTENKITVTESASKTNNAIDSEGDVELGGKGKTTITANQKHAVSASNVKLKGAGTINITAKKDGIQCKKLEVTGATTTITAGDDGVQAEVSKKSKKGTVEIAGGTLNIKDCAGKGIKAESAITVSDGELNITGCDVGISAKYSGELQDTFVHKLIVTGGAVKVSDCTTSSITCEVEKTGGTVTVNGAPYAA